MSTPEYRPLDLSLRCYRRLLRAYPPAFLADFEELLIQAFGDLANRAVRTNGIRGLLRLWLRTIPDLAGSALSQRFRSTSDWSFRLRWILACALAIPSGMAVNSLVAFIFFEIRRFSGIPSVPLSGSMFPFVLSAPAALVMGAVVQALAFEWKRSRRAGWVLATVFGVVFTVVARNSIFFLDNYLSVHPLRWLYHHNPTLNDLVVLLVFPLSIGMFQTFVLARQSRRAVLWIPVSAVGVLSSGYIFSALLIQVFDRHMWNWLYAPGLIVGAVYGVMTVIPLEWILRRVVAEDLVESGSKHQSLS